MAHHQGSRQSHASHQRVENRVDNRNVNKLAPRVKYYNIGLVMHLLNHSSAAMTLAYLGLDQASRETMLNQIDFG